MKVMFCLSAERDGIFQDEIPFLPDGIIEVMNDHGWKVRSLGVHDLDNSHFADLWAAAWAEAEQIVDLPPGPEVWRP